MITLNIFTIIGFLVVLLILLYTVNYIEDFGRDEGSGVFSSMTILVFIVLVYFIDNGSFIIAQKYILEHYKIVLYGFGIYFIIGLIWSFFKWWIFVKDVKERLIARDVKISETDRPLPEEYPSTIIMWISYWPFSLTWAMINNPVKKFTKFLFNRFTGVYSKISKDTW